MTYKTFIDADRRLAILRFLAEENDYTLNDSVMQAALEQLGHCVARAVVIADFEFLRDIGLITLEIFKEKIQVAKLTARGFDVSKGLIKVSGVKHPSPLV